MEDVTATDQRYFSVGGIIGLGLFVNEWDLKECSERFTTLCRKAFTPRDFSGVARSWMYWMSLFRHRFQTEPLEKALKEAFSDDKYLLGGKRPRGATKTFGAKIGITTSSATSGSILFTDYNRFAKGRIVT